MYLFVVWIFKNIEYLINIAIEYFLEPISFLIVFFIEYLEPS